MPSWNAYSLEDRAVLISKNYMMNVLYGKLIS